MDKNDFLYIGKPKTVRKNSAKQELLFVLFFVLSLTTSCAQQQKDLKEVTGFGDNPGNLKMFVHENSSKKTTNLPLVVVLHGCSQDAADAAALTGWNKLADLNNFMVLYPQQKLLNNPNLCFNWFNGPDVEKDRGECESIFEMIIYTQQHYSIDSSKIFITGLSAGAAMSVVLAATHPDLFKTGAIFAGCAYKMAKNPLESFSVMLGNKSLSGEELVKSVKEQNPDYKGKYPGMIVYQGASDPIVNYRNSAFIMKQWTGINNADTIPDSIEQRFMGIENITRSEFTDSSGRVTVIVYDMKKLGHQLMIKPGEKEEEGGRIGMFGVNKGFHSTYQTAKEFGIIKPIKQ